MGKINTWANFEIKIRKYAPLYQYVTHISAEQQFLFLELFQVQPLCSLSHFSPYRQQKVRKTNTSARQIKNVIAA